MTQSIVLINDQRGTAKPRQPSKVVVANLQVHAPWAPGGGGVASAPETLREVGLPLNCSRAPSMFRPQFRVEAIPYVRVGGG